MSSYVDTSVLVAYYYPEPTSAKVENFLTKQKQPSLSWLTGVEFTSAVAKKVRQKELRLSAAKSIMETFQSHISEGYYQQVPIRSSHYSAARTWLASFQTSLRALDAIHLAIAASQNLTIVTSDRLLAKSAKVLEISVRLI